MAKGKQAEQRAVIEAMSGPVELHEHFKQMVRQDPRIWRNWTNPKHRVSRSKAIRLKCLDCCCGSFNEVRLCQSITCALWPYRLGREDRTYAEVPEE